MMEIIVCWLLLLGLFSGQEQADCAKENLARRGAATQSTSSGAKSADLAIDGGKDFSTSSSTCATTSWEQNPWWRLDLQSAHLPSIVVVTYRDDSFPGTMRPIQVFFGNSLQIYGYPRFPDYIKRSFMKLVFNSSADLTDPTVTDQVLKELTSALAVRGITNVTLSWSQTPEEEEVIQRQVENDSC